MKKWFGYNPPFFGGHQQVLSRQADDRLIKNDIMQLLLTSVGERVMRPTFGTILKPSLFEPMTDILARDIRGNIISQINKVETRINNVEVGVDKNDDTNTLNVVVSGQLNNIAENRRFIVEVELPFEQP